MRKRKRSPQQVLAPLHTGVVGLSSFPSSPSTLSCLQLPNISVLSSLRAIACYLTHALVCLKQQHLVLGLPSWLELLPPAKTCWSLWAVCGQRLKQGRGEKEREQACIAPSPHGQVPAA